jgi:hypothetical protein
VGKTTEKVKLSLYQTKQAYRVLRRRDSNIFLNDWLTDGGEIVNLTSRWSFKDFRYS